MSKYCIIGTGRQGTAALYDIISFGKKTQVCGILAGNRIDEVEDNVFSESSRINSTFGGNLVDMTRFKIILEIIEEENLLLNSKKTGKILRWKNSRNTKFKIKNNVNKENSGSQNNE